MSDSDEPAGSLPIGDPLLEFVVNMLETIDATIPSPEGPSLSVTLSVQGSIVTGLAIVERAYRRALVERVRQAFAAGPLSPIADHVSAGLQQTVDDAPPRGEGTPYFIHLREAYFIAGGAMVPTPRPEAAPLVLRIPIVRVDAFSIGRVTTAA